MIKTQAYSPKQRSPRFIALCWPRLGCAPVSTEAHGLGIDRVGVLEGVP